MRRSWTQTPTAWWTADDGECHSRVMAYVSEVERVQSHHFDRFLKLACLYDPHHQAAGEQEKGVGQMVENVIASNCDAIVGTLAATEVRARFMTDDGDWSTQRTARSLELYAEGVSKLLELDDACRGAFHDASLKGTGLVMVYVDQWGDLKAERVAVDEIIVDDGEVRGGGLPRQMHRRKFVARDVLLAEFPDHEEAIRRAQTGPSSAGQWRYWAGYRPLDREELVVLESWYLPIGRKGKKGYKPGRHSIVIDGEDLFDEEWNKPHFPIARMVWTERPGSWYGIGGAERIIGHQRTLNKSNWQIDKQIDNHAIPITYIRPADANIAVKTIHRGGTFMVCKGEYPKTYIPPAVSPETYKRHEDAKSSAFEEFGQSRMAAAAMKPAGIDSGVALREYRDQTTQRFASQEKAHEKLKLDCIWLAIDCCRDLGDEAPTIVRKSKHGPKKIPWSKVDMDEVRVQICAASTLARTPAGRQQLVMELAQAGIVSQDEARRLMRHPDTERALSLYTAAIEDIERCIEEILDGELVVPEPFQNLKLGVWRFQQAYLKSRDDGAPETVLESLRTWITQASWMIAQAETPAPAPALAPGGVSDVGAGAVPMAPMAPPGLGMEPPPMAPPQAALAEQAMNLRAV